MEETDGNLSVSSWSSIEGNINEERPSDFSWALLFLNLPWKVCMSFLKSSFQYIVSVVLFLIETCKCYVGNKDIRHECSTRLELTEEVEYIVNTVKRNIHDVVQVLLF